MSERHLWMGGDCPVDPETVVEVEFRGMERATTPAGRLYWGRAGKPGDIVSYRVIPEPALIGPDVNQSDPPPCPKGEPFYWERAAAAYTALVGEVLPAWKVRLMAELLRMAEEAEKNG